MEETKAQEKKEERPKPMRGELGSSLDSYLPRAFARRPGWAYSPIKLITQRVLVFLAYLCASEASRMCGPRFSLLRVFFLHQKRSLTSIVPCSNFEKKKLAENAGTIETQEPEPLSYL